MIDDRCMFMYLMSLYVLVFSNLVSVSIQLLVLQAQFNEVDANHTKLWRCNYHIVLVTCIGVSPN